MYEGINELLWFLRKELQYNYIYIAPEKGTSLIKITVMKYPPLTIKQMFKLYYTLLNLMKMFCVEYIKDQNNYSVYIEHDVVLAWPGLSSVYGHTIDYLNQKGKKKCY